MPSDDTVPELMDPHPDDLYVEPPRRRDFRLDVYDEAELIGSLFRSTAALYRLEALTADPSLRKIVSAWARRREAMAVAAAADRVGVFEESIANMGREFLIGISSKADRLAADILETLAKCAEIDIGKVSEADVRAVWELSEQSNLRLASSETQWRLERDCANAASQIVGNLKNKTPWGAAEVLRHLWIADGFEGAGRRMTLMLASAIVGTGFGVRTLAGGLASQVISEVDRMDRIALSPDDFFVLVCRGAEKSATSAREAGLRLQRLSIEFAKACGVQRAKSSRIGSAIEAFLSYPIMTPQSLRTTLGTTDRGTELIIEKLMSSGCIALHESSTRRNRTLICRKAINLVF